MPSRVNSTCMGEPFILTIFLLGFLTCVSLSEATLLVTGQLHYIPLFAFCLGLPLLR